MEEKKVSGGARKVETTEKAVNRKRTEAKQAASARKEAAEQRLAAKQEKKTRRMELRAARKEKAAARKAAFREKQAQRKAERSKRRELLKNETATQRMKRKEREKKERLALAEKRRTERKERALKAKEIRLQKKQARLENRKHKRENRTPGFGGWLAAVISLGVSTLVLATVVMAGAFDMADRNTIASAGYRSSLYELTGLMDEMETDLSKLRVSGTAAGQRRLATDLLVNSALAEGALERVPADIAVTASLTSVINGTREFSQELLTKLASGQPMGEAEEAQVETLYARQAELKGDLNALACTMTDDDLSAFVKKGKGKLSEFFGGIEDKGEAMASEAAELALGAEITSAEAEEFVRSYFAEYDLQTVEYAGEANAETISCYNFALTDGRGREMFAQISKEGGKLVFFDSYEECSAKNYNVEKCEEIAEDFLDGLGLDDMESVFVSESGTTVDFTFVYEQGDVLVYPDTVKVKVCETKGVVIGMEAVEFWNTHKQRAIPKAKLTPAEARRSLERRLTLEETELALIPVNGKETLCYEFYGKHGDESYLVYLDANTGDEAAIYTIVETKQGNIRK